MAGNSSVYVRSTLIGSALGALLGLAGALKAVATQSPLLDDGVHLKLLSLGTVGGAVAGLLWPALGRLRNRGAVGFYAAWIIALTVTGMALMVPSASSWQDLRFGAFLGSITGFGLAAFVRYARGPSEESS